MRPRLQRTALGLLMRSARTLRMPVLALTLGLGASACIPMDNLMFAIFGRSMRSQESFDPYENTRMAPEGSVPFAAGNFPANRNEVGLGQAEGVAIPAPVTQGDLLTRPEVVDVILNPVPADAQSLARGQVVFQRACTPCHGVAGAGDGPVVAVGMLAMPLISEQARGYSDGYLYSIIRVGRGLMPAYGHQITHFDRWNVVNYVRQLQGQ